MTHRKWLQMWLKDDFLWVLDQKFSTILIRAGFYVTSLVSGQFVPQSCSAGLCLCALTGTYPPVVCRTVVELGDDLLGSFFELGPEKLKFLWDKREGGPVIVWDVDLETKSKRREGSMTTFWKCSWIKAQGGWGWKTSIKWLSKTNGYIMSRYKLHVYSNFIV